MLSGKDRFRTNRHLTGEQRSISAGWFIFRRKENEDGKFAAF